MISVAKLTAMERLDSSNLKIAQKLTYKLRCRNQGETTVLLHPEDNDIMDTVELKNSRGKIALHWDL